MKGSENCSGENKRKQTRNTQSCRLAENVIVSGRAALRPESKVDTGPDSPGDGGQWWDQGKGMWSLSVKRKGSTRRGGSLASTRATPVWGGWWPRGGEPREGRVANPMKVASPVKGEWRLKGERQ